MRLDLQRKLPAPREENRFVPMVRFLSRIPSVRVRSSNQACHCLSTARVLYGTFYILSHIARRALATFVERQPYTYFNTFRYVLISVLLGMYLFQHFCTCTHFSTFERVLISVCFTCADISTSTYTSQTDTFMLGTHVYVTTATTNAYYTNYYIRSPLHLLLLHCKRYFLLTYRHSIVNL
jgi:hypothetical protein